MNANELLHITKNLQRQAFDAYAYRQIIRQYHANLKEYSVEMKYSSAFYSIVYQSLHESLLMCLAKIYEWDKRSLTIRTILDEIRNMTICDEIDRKYVFHHTLRKNEETYFQDEVNRTKQACEIFGIDYASTQVDLIFSAMVDLYSKRFSSLQGRQVINRLMERRNKAYAHNDKQSNFDLEELGKKFPLNFKEIDELIEFALDFTGFIIFVLTGKFPGSYISNIEDWRWTLESVRAAKGTGNKTNI